MLDYKREEEIEDLVKSLQAKKINSLLEDCERLGTEKFSLLERLNGIATKLNCTAPEIENKIEELLKWQHLGKTRLGPNLDHASSHLDHLFMYAKELNKPSLRIVKASGKVFRDTWIGKKVNRTLQMIILILKSERV